MKRSTPAAQPSAGRGPVIASAQSATLEAGPAPLVSVVVATRDRATMVIELLGSIEAQTLSLRCFEVVMVDDGSTDGTWRALEAGLATTRLRGRALRLAAGVGQGAARNLGVAAARGQVVAFTDDDCLVSPEWLAKLVRPFGRLDWRAAGAAGGPPHREPAARAVQGRTVAWPGDAATAGPWDRTMWVLGTTWRFETCNIAYRRADLVAAGGFPARAEAPCTATGKAVGEDALAGWRVAAGGARPVFCDRAVVFHRHLPASYRQWLAAQWGKQVFPDLVRRDPRGRKALWHRCFLSARSAATDLAVAGLALWAVAPTGRRRGARRGRASARWGWLALGAVAPWLWLALPEAADRRGRHPAVRLVQLAAGDLVGMAALGWGSLRHRRVVL